MSNHWERVQRFHSLTKRPVIVCCGYTTDAIASTQILTGLLRACVIPYSVHPILDVGELQSKIAHTEDDAEPELFFLVGIGAAVPLEPLFQPARHVVFVMDNQRPVHLSNLLSESQAVERAPVDENGMPLPPWLVLWQSEDIRRDVEAFFSEQARVRGRHAKRRRRRSEAKLLQRRRKEHAMRDLQDEEDVGDAKSSNKKSKKKKKSKDTRDENDAAAADVDGDEEDAENASLSGSDHDNGSDISQDDDEEEDEELSASDKESRDSDDEEDDDDLQSDHGDDDDDDLVQSSQKLDWQAPSASESLPKDVVGLYYSAEYSGQSVALDLLRLSTELNRAKDWFWWNAAVGITDLFLRQCTDYSTYLLSITQVRDQIALQASARRSSATVEPDSNADRSQPRLFLADEPQLMLLRHWSLWSALWYGKLSSSLLRLHHADHGEEVLRELLAKCGVSVRAAQQSWVELSRDERPKAQSLVCLELEKLEAMHVARRDEDLDSLLGGGGGGASDSELSGSVPWKGSRRATSIPLVKHPNILPTVLRSSGWGANVSAFDVCHLMRALLCAPLPMTSENSSSREALDAASLEHHKAAFWKAHDLLADANPNAQLFHVAMGEVKRLHAQVSSATSSLMQHGVVMSTRVVHYTLLVDPSRRSGAMDSFWLPLRLQYLAEHAAYALTVERGRSFSMRPVVLCCALPVRDGSSGNLDTYRIGIAHSGAVNGPNRALPAVAAWMSVVQSLSQELAASGDTTTLHSNPLQPRSVVVRGRDAASLLIESMYLQCLRGRRGSLGK